MTDLNINNVSFIGPFVEQWAVCLDGYKIPNMSAIVRKDGDIMLSLDNRFLIQASPEECAKWLWIVANAMAIGSGYSCFGENSVKQPNPFTLKMSGINIQPNLTLVSKDNSEA